MNKKDIIKAKDKFSKENQEIGKIFLKVHKLQKQREEIIANKKEETSYLRRLRREIGIIYKEYSILKEKIKNHPLLKNKASEELIGLTLFDFLLNKFPQKRISNREKIGSEIINEICKHTSSHLVVFPLSGFIPTSRFLKIGNVVFGVAEDILEYFNLKLKNTFENNFLRTVCVGTSVTTFDKNSALILAENKINLTINFVRIFIPVTYNLHKQPKIRIYDESKKRYIFPLQYRDFLRTFPEYDLLPTVPVSSIILGKFKTKRILEEGNRILKKEPYELSKLDKRILNSLGWIGEGIDANEYYLKVVKCVVGLETLFKLKDDNKQSEFVDCVVKLFKNPSIDIGKVRRDAKNLYGLRSAIVHGGKRNIKDEDAEIAERLTSGCLLKVLENLSKFTCEKDFYAWLKK